jgi:hypothetical protein
MAAIEKKTIEELEVREITVTFVFWIWNGAVRNLEKRILKKKRWIIAGNSYPHIITTAVWCLLFSFCTWRSFDPKVMWLREIVWIRGFLQFACPPF